jgi:RNA polymerase sigma-70 factor (ECF subfamily)
LPRKPLGEAFVAALESWPREGVPRNARSWLVSAGRFRAIDALRRRARFDELAARLAERVDVEPRHVDDDELPTTACA